MRHCLRELRMPALLLLAALLVGGASPTPTPAPPSGDAAFRAAADRFIVEHFRLYPESATQEGYHRFDTQAADLSREGIERRIRHAMAWKDRFSQIDPKTLSGEDEADREWLIAICDGELLRSQQIRTHQREPGLYIPTAGVYALLERNFAPLEERMRLVTAREHSALGNFDAARQNLKPKTMPKIAAEIVAQEMAGTAGFFAVELAVAFARLPEGPAKQEFAETNRKTIGAIEAYQKWLMEAVAPKASDKFAIGEDAYRRMLADDDMVDLPLSQLEEVGERELARLKANFRATAEKIDPNHSPTEVLTAISREHPGPRQVIAAVTSGLAEVRAFVIAHRLATIPSEVSPIVKETPPYMRATTFASMDSPGPYEQSAEAFFYVTLPDPSWSPAQKEQSLELLSAPTISDISVHEVYPGHYVQFLNNRLNPDKVRSVFYSGANIEGWGLYCEEMMLDQGLRGNDPAYRLAQIQMALQRACRYLVGIRMHTREMTVARAARFFEENAYMTPHNAMVEALRGTQDPGYLRYQLGKLMIMKLRDDVRKKEGAAFDLGRFHDAFLRQGAIPIKLIRRAMLGSDGVLL